MSGIPADCWPTIVEVAAKKKIKGIDFAILRATRRSRAQVSP
jgi:hypothetical protein